MAAGAATALTTEARWRVSGGSCTTVVLEDRVVDLIERRPVYRFGVAAPNVVAASVVQTITLVLDDSST